MKFYISKSTGGFYISEINGATIPKDAVEITKTLYLQLLSGINSGTKNIEFDSSGYPQLVEKQVEEREYAADQERYWRDGELLVADHEINKLQDSDTKAFGTVAAWRSYRKELRAWPEHINFPNKEFRPVSPRIKE